MFLKENPHFVLHFNEITLPLQQYYKALLTIKKETNRDKNHHEETIRFRLIHIII